jgi:hypothetical protein
MVEALNEADEARNENSTPETEDAWKDAEQAIHEDHLSVEVRSDWYLPTAYEEIGKPAEYRILFCTGGPAVQIRGRLSEHGEPETAHLEVQDWFTPWTKFDPRIIGHPCVEDVLLAYARCFCFGE